MIKAMLDRCLSLVCTRVNLGNPGSGQYQNSIDALKAVGLNPERDIYSEKVKASEAPGLLQDNRIDAFFCTVGHPSETLQEATSGKRRVRFIPVIGPGIDELIADRPYYTQSTVPVAQFYPNSEEPASVKTFGVVATLCTSARVSAYVVYTITKEVFGNFDEFRRQHPALTGLTKGKMLRGLTAPLHPGAIEYYKEVGLMK